MKTRSFIIVLGFLSFVSVGMAKGPQERRTIGNDPIPLHNWSVPFTQQLNDRHVVSLAASAPANFVAVTPCRLVDTRRSPGPYGGPAFAAGETRTYNVPGGPCAGIPIAVAYSLNFTIVNYDVSSAGFVTTYPTGSARPFVSTVNFGNGTNAVANAAIAAANGGGSIDVYSSGATNLIIDINGYFPATVAAASTSPIRVTPNNLGIWHVINDLGCGAPATTGFTNGEPTTPPLGTGSFKVTTASNAESAAMATEAYSGTLVSDISVLRYSTKVSGGPATDQPYIYLQLDDNGDGTQDRTIYFIPANNLAGEGDTMTDVWQTWDARNGMWNEGSDTGTPGAVPLSTFGSSHILGIRIASGCGPTLTAPDDHYTDDFEIGIGGANPIVYDFERN